MKQPLEITSNIEVDLMKDVEDVVSSKILSSQNEDSNESFFVCDLGDVVQKYKLWSTLMPRVKPFYDVRCNDDSAVLTVLSQLDVGFHCSGTGDIKTVLDLGIETERLIYSSPCKLSSHVKFAASHGVQLIEFESETELHKIKSYHPNASLLLKILPSDSSVCNQSLNFGCRMNNVSALLSVAKRLHLDVVGISIQTRDSCLDVTRAVAVAHSVFELAEKEGFNLTLLDVGESIPKNSSAEFALEERCSMLQLALDDYFPDGSGVTVLGEAGGFFVESAFTLVARVINKTVIAGDLDLDGVALETQLDPDASEPDIIYYLSDGIFQSFSGILYNGHSVKPALIDCERFAGAPRHASRLLGPTDDSLDCILSSCFLPELFIGDWILFHDMGAYATAGSMTNMDDDMTRPECHYTMRAKDWIHLCCCSTAARMSQLNIFPVNTKSSADWLDV